MGNIVGSIAGALVSSLVSGMMGGGRDREERPAQAPVTRPPQAARAPEPAAVRNQNASAALMGGQQSTLLTGTSGVGNDELNLGRNTLLGS